MAGPTDTEPAADTTEDLEISSIEVSQHVLGNLTMDHSLEEPGLFRLAVR